MTNSKLLSLLVGGLLFALGISIIIKGYSFHSGSGITTYYGFTKYFVGGVLAIYGAYMAYASLKR